MKTQAQNNVVYSTLLYNESLAIGLFLFAQKNESFRKSIKSKLPENLKSTFTDKILIDEKFTHLVPQTHENAEQRLSWVLNNQPSPLTLQILQDALYEKPNELPKAVVLGIAIGVLPVGAFGLHKKKSKITNISRDDLRDTGMIAKGSTHVALRLLEQSVRANKGDIKRIEPEMHDWFFGEKQMSLRKADKKTLTKIKQELERLDVPFSYTEDERGITFIAISPSINPETLTLDFDLNDL